MEIILIRHGKPTAANNPRLSASGFAEWVERYNQSDIDPSSLPPKGLNCSLEGYFIVTSQLPRAIDSAEICLNKKPDLILSRLNEMPLPCYNFPFILKAYTWLVIHRILWMLGISGRVESFKSAKIRAKKAAIQLHKLAIEHKKVAVFGHCLLNKYIAKELTKLGANQTISGKGFWSAIRLTFS
ncbi:hypothetical protein ACR30L_14855 [Psychromonas sp. PT13]|uniref:hypothetical protein n=1 Tax=Psychromonas sp. PT13 TaxID=3439547 RepID=UPI003EBB2538